MKHVARKRFGQNFLTDKHVLNDIIEGIAPQRGESPRVFGRRLVAESGADAAAVSVLVSAIERESYAPREEAGPTEPLDQAVRAVRAGLLEATDGRTHLASSLTPRSLFGRRSAPISRATG